MQIGDLVAPLVALGTDISLDEAYKIREWQCSALSKESDEHKKITEESKRLQKTIAQALTPKQSAHLLISNFLNNFQPDQNPDLPNSKAITEPPTLM